MNYQTFEPHPDLKPVVKCYWLLEIPAAADSQKQRIIPDGCIEMIFILGDDVKRYTSGDNFILQPRAMVLGQITEPFFVEPTGFVSSIAVRFYPFGFASFISTPIQKLANKETPLVELFGETGLEQKIFTATDTKQRIEILEKFLLNKMKSADTIDNVVKSTIDVILSKGGSTPVNDLVKDDVSKRRQLERKFLKQVGMSPKQLGKVIRLQTALKMVLNQPSESLTQIAYESEYYDQAHFIKDFREFTGTTPGSFLSDEEMILSSLIYKKD